MALDKHTIPFLEKLQKNNNREWFHQHKEEYKAAHQEYLTFIQELITVLSDINPNLIGLQAKNCVYRIYRDIRFSKDKTPYKNHFGANITQGGGKSKYAGMYVHIEPGGNSMAGGGIYRPEAPILKALRNEFYQVPEELLEILDQPEFKKHFPALWQDDKLKTAPKGFPKDFKHIDLLRYKSYIVMQPLMDKEIKSPKLFDTLIASYKAMYPLNRLINTIIDDAGL